MNSKSLSAIIFLLILGFNLNAQSTKDSPPDRKHFIGSTLFLSFTFLLEESPHYYQLNYGYRISEKDAISVEAITWTYTGPLGRPYGKDYENSASDFPGKIQALGMGLAYQRFLWKGVYAQIHSTAFHQNYFDSNDHKIQSGFQLFNTLRFGYHFKVFNKRLFLEPSIAFTSWPINTNLPDSFQVEEDKWPKYFLFEPGFHFGFNF